MIVQTQETPNPATLKFLPGRDVTGRRTVDFQDPDAARDASPLATALFAVDGVIGVCLGADFISVSKSADLDWFALKPLVLAAIMEHYFAERPILTMPEPEPEVRSSDPVIARIQEILDTRVRPAVAQDGGDVVFHGFERGIVYLGLRGACVGCPSSSATLKLGIERLLRYELPEVLEVRASLGALS